ncbi:hypothetical protein ACFFRR_002413 [Megaselia abdita]
MKYSISVTPRSPIKHTSINLVEISIDRDDLDGFSEKRCVFTEEFPSSIERLLNFKVRTDDVWIVALPKCGIEFFSEMVWLIQNNFNFEKSLSSSNNVRAPHVELKALFNFANDSFAVADDLESPRILKTHLSVQFLPKEFFVKKPKVVFIYRDAAEAAIAYYHLCCAIGCYNGTKEDFIEFFMNNGGPYLPFWQHMASYDQYFSGSGNIFSVEYSRCKEKMSVEDSVKGLCKFLGKPVPNKTVLEKVKEHLQMYTDSDGLTTQDQDYRFPVELEKRFNDWCVLNGGKELDILKMKK